MGERPSSEHAGAGVWVVIPTYNERANLEAMTRAVLQAVPQGSILVVDDNSPDGTGELADQLAASDTRIAVLHRSAKDGLGAAYRAGFAHVLADPGCGAVIQMDCDFSHDPADLPRLLESLERGADVAIGSRYVRGGGIPRWSLGRRLLSRAGGVFARLVLRLPVADLTGGFKAWRPEQLRAIGFTRGYASGYGFQIEMTYRAHLLGARIAEVPIIFGDRAAGESKMTSSIAREALTAVIRMRLAGRRLVAPEDRPVAP